MRQQSDAEQGICEYTHEDVHRQLISRVDRSGHSLHRVWVNAPLLPSAAGGFASLKKLAGSGSLLS